MSRFSTCLAIIGQLELAFKVTSTSYGALIKNVTFETLFLNIHYRIHPILSILVLRCILNQDWLLCFNGVHNNHRFIVLPDRKKLPTPNFSSGDEQCLALRSFRLQRFFVLIFFQPELFVFCVFLLLFLPPRPITISQSWTADLICRSGSACARYGTLCGSAVVFILCQVRWTGGLS